MAAATYTTKEASDRLGIHPSRVRRLANQYHLGTRKGERALIFTTDDLAVLDRIATRKVGRPPLRKSRHGDPPAAEPPLDASPAKPMGS